MIPPSQCSGRRKQKPVTKEPMTRQERKALDREMPWRCIMRGVEEVIEQYTQTNIKWAERSRLPEDAFQPAMLHGRSGRRRPCELPV